MPSPSSPYYLFGSQRRYPYAWHGGAGGVPWSRPAAETRELSGLGDALTRWRRASGLGDWPAFYPAGPERIDPGLAGCRCSPTDGFDLVESGLSPYSIAYPAFNRTRLHSLGDIPIWSGLSDNEKKVAMLGGAAALAWWLWKKRGKAGGRGSRRLARATRGYVRNPGRRRRRRKARR